MEPIILNYSPDIYYLIKSLERKRAEEAYKVASREVEIAKSNKDKPQQRKLFLLC